MKGRSRTKAATIRDPDLWEAGERRIQWAMRHSPVLRQLARTTLTGRPLADRRLALVIHLGPKTAYLAIVLADAGAEIVAVSSNPGSVHDDVAAALVRRGITVHAVRGCAPHEWEGHLDRAIDMAPELIIDDGAELVGRLVRRRPELRGGIVGSSEETTTGVHRLRALEREGALTWPAIAANTARCKHLFDNRYGSGQSVTASIVRNTNLWMSGKVVAVVGYGWVGRGVADYARGLGAQVVVTEVDPVAALEAHTDGSRVMSLQEASAIADIFITCTGSWHVIGVDELLRMKDGAILANAGHHAHEIDVDALKRTAVDSEPARPNLVAYRMPNGHRLHLLADGQVANLTAAEGHPVEIMDLTFAVQASAVAYLAAHGREMPPGLHLLPASVDAGIAQAKLDSLGIAIDRVTDEQRRFLASADGTVGA